MTARARWRALLGLGILLLPLFLLEGCRRTGETAPRDGAVGEARQGKASETVEAKDVLRDPNPAGRGAPVFWLGLDGLDWELLDRLSAQGKMPNWKRLVSEGSSGKLSAFMPVLSPILWTTAATGVGPDQHRVLDFQQVDAKTGRKAPISGTARAVPAVWNIASGSGKKVGVVGWWATHPAEEVNGFFISDHASPILFDKLPLSGAAFPAALSAGIDQVLGREGRVTDAELMGFLAVPIEEISRARASGAGMENKIVALSRILAQTRVYHRIARDLYDKNRPDLMVLYLQGTDEIGHVFAPYVPPRLSCVTEADYARYQRAVDVYYSLVDQVLGQWMRRAEEDRGTLFVHSDHGFKWGQDRSCDRPSFGWATAAYWHRLDGVYAAWGSRAAHSPASASTRGVAASLFDVAPTVLALLNLPADRRMSGRPIGTAFRDLPALAKKETFASGEVRRVPAEEMSPAEANEYAKKLLALGYISGKEASPLAPTGGERAGLTEGAWNNLGLYYRETRKDLGKAREAFEKSLELRPGYHSPMFNLAVLYREKREYEKAQDWLFRSLEAGHADPEGTLELWTGQYLEEGKLRQARSLLERAAPRYPTNELFARELGLARFRAKDCDGASRALTAFAPATSDANTLNALGLFETCLGRREEATRLFERSLALKPDQPAVVQSLTVLQRGGR